MLKKLWVGLGPGNQGLHSPSLQGAYLSGPLESFTSVPRLEDWRSCLSGKQATAPSQQGVWTRSITA